MLERIIGPEEEEEGGQIVLISPEMLGGPPPQGPSLDSEEERQEKHDAEMEDFRWDRRIKEIERTSPIPIFITQEHITAEGIKEEQVIEQILSAAFFPEREAHIYVNTYGGDVHTMFAIMDAIQSLPNTTKTIGIGKIMSAGGPILLSGDVRSMTKNSYLMIHDISAVMAGTPAEVQAELEFIEKLKKRFARFVSVRSKLTPQMVMDLMDEKKNSYFSAEEALEMGLIDEIIGNISMEVEADEEDYEEDYEEEEDE